MTDQESSSTLRRVAQLPSLLLPSHRHRYQGMPRCRAHAHIGPRMEPQCLGFFHAGSSVGPPKNQINPGLTSVDRNATTTLAPYNAWFQLSHLRTTYHLHTFQFKVPAAHLAARCVHMQYGIGLVLLMWMRKWWSSLLGKHGFRLRGIQSYSNRW